ncbi:DEAD/DEAH box helicase [Flavimobilis sp. GY10621]|uniref:DEAD/DEAH box helicase n=1 Tax=Flavimobilis rhizosphaerae TaxID=2775421 RepID=A0ABR9DRM5_9MICO|nr:DEAD/DEAH box helicase [Flavimobilis rhizosphaerae]MBD9699799.1 DEAD/DEAH box helicase [Flavimobilis rhizosphaerae]
MLPPSPPGPVRAGADARALVDRHVALVDRARAVVTHLDDVAVAVAAWVRDDEARRVRDELSRVPVGRLGETTERNLRLTAVENAGYATAADFLGVRPETFDAIPGVGDATARGVVAAVDQLAKAAVTLRPLRITLDRAGLPEPREARDLLALLRRFQRVTPLVAPHRRELDDYVRFGGQATHDAAPARHAARMLLTLPRTRRAAHAALARLQEWDERIAINDLPGIVARAEAEIAATDPAGIALAEDFARRSAEYFTTLQEIVPHAAGVLAARGLLPADLVARVDAHPLDTSLLRVALRGYQEFGARFALEQGRVLLGDEMGLGKTMQALAAIAHLAADGHRRFLVVCPASLLANWEHEIQLRTSLAVHRAHGSGRADALAVWEREGGIGLTTFEGLAHVPLPGTSDDDPGLSPDLGRVGLLVVDEAQQVKNPRAARSKLVAAWAQRCARVLLMSGTPMDNRLEDFLALTELLQPGLAATIPKHLGLVGPEAFRHAVAHVYLRRNQSDVLVELPGIVASDDWVELREPEERAYRAAVEAGNLMAMRQAAWHPTAGESPAKLDRLLDLVDEALDEGHSVLVFSYFRTTLDLVSATLAARGVAVHGPLTGDVPVARRGELVDAFTSDDTAVLVAQISVGGTGLNLQAASVVVLCEPQLTPTLEDQAIARAHRMGQVRPVRAHRLLGSDGVDERIVEILGRKREVFDDYVRVSSLAQAAVGSIDVARGDLAREVVAAEQARLGYGPWWDELNEPSPPTLSPDQPESPQLPLRYRAPE